MTEPTADLVDAKIAALGDWRGQTLARVRALICGADPDRVAAPPNVKNPAMKRCGESLQAVSLSAAMAATMARIRSRRSVVVGSV